MPISLGTTTVTALFLGTTSITSAYLGNTQVFGGSFTPLSLFSGGAQGIWLDPSDLSTMFSDRAGTTPVTTPGTVVGLRLDKSKGLTLGAELVTNGDFSGGTTDWTPQDGNVVLSTSGGAGVATYSATSTFYQAISVQAGKTYRATAIIKRDSGSGTPFMNFRDGPSLNNSVIGQSSPTGYTSASYAPASAWFVAASTGTVYLHFPCVATASTVVSIDNISVRELPGNHAQAPTDAARPIYGVEPKGGRRNLLTYSEAFNESVWVKAAGVTVTTNTDVAPDGTTTADTVTSGGNEISQSTACIISTAYTDSVYFKKTSGAAYQPSIYLLFSGGTTVFYAARLNTDTGVAAAISAGGFATPSAVVVSDAGSFWRLSVSGNSNNNTTAVLRVYANMSSGGGVGAGSQVIWGAQLELGSTATNYQRVLSAYDVTESGVATCHYVQYDGRDGSMSTSAIDFTATDKMSVFAGVRKLSDAAQGAILEHSVGGQNGSFGLWTGGPVVPGANYHFNSRGTALGIAIAPTSYPAPISNVATCLGDIAGDTSTIRLNGTQVAQVTTDQGTGNFGNYPIFMGRRNNATYPFNGRDYGLIVVGKTASGTEITDTETWLAARTAEVDVAKSISPNIYTRSGDTILDRANSIIERRAV